MESFIALLNTLSSFIWGPFTLVLLLGVGTYLSLGLKLIPWRKIPYAFRQLLSGRKASGDGEISPFNALMTAMSATVGTGNIAGVATAIFIGGPGAIFWMWITALVGMATKYSEALLAVKYRETNANGQYVGGPMYYIKNGLGAGWGWLAFLFALFGTIAAFGIGNMVQSNSVAAAMYTNFQVSHHLTGAVIAILAALVILGGIKRLGIVAGKLVPLMALIYIIGSLLIIISNFSAVPAALMMIVDSAFNGSAAAGGFAGAAVMMGIQMGVARGIFSNEAGLGSAPIAHAAAQTNSPVRQGLIAMLGTFIDTLVICTMTALVIIISGVWTSGETGASLSSLAYGSLLPFGEYIITFGLVIFAFTTILGWSYYGERCASYLFGERIILPYRIAWIFAIFIGAFLKVNLIWILADVMNGFMALPNLIALALLSPVIFAVTKDYLAANRKN
ncbi:MAG: sodium:alanine symporter family protein [Gammaproteobacteria bacterium]|jgi:AGCS family alanine or glycine:cation symporter|nr:sodium:alanine symporter family protein [Gammaproteobacteria bacterium]|tara:strand:+ start:4376 stop:5719 length:1344 start_codon:yes stop_codon:yes gene_type:complete